MDIYGTLGPSCQTKEILTGMFRAGMTGMRLNLSHTALPFLFRGITMSPVIPWVPAIFPAAAPHRILFCFNYIDKCGFVGVIGVKSEPVNQTRLLQPLISRSAFGWDG